MALAFPAFAAAGFAAAGFAAAGLAAAGFAAAEGLPFAAAAGAAFFFTGFFKPSDIFSGKLVCMQSSSLPGRSARALAKFGLNLQDKGSGGRQPLLLWLLLSLRSAAQHGSKPRSPSDDR